MGEEHWAERWLQEGFAIARGILDPARAERLREICERILAAWRVCTPETGEAGGGADATVMWHLNHSGYFQKSDQMSEMREGFAALMEAVSDPQVLAVCRAILGEEPLFRCTSLFVNPLETSRDGNWHRDSQFHCPVEAEERKLIQSGGDAGHAVQLQLALVASSDVEIGVDLLASTSVIQADGFDTELRAIFHLSVFLLLTRPYSLNRLGRNS